MSMFGNVHVAYSVALVVSFILFYFLVNYKMSNLIDEKFAKQEKRTAKKAASLYRKYGSGMREKETEQRHIQMMREREREKMAERHNRPLNEEDSDEDSVKNVGGFNSSVNHASFEDNNTD